MSEGESQAAASEPRFSFSSPHNSAGETYDVATAEKVLTAFAYMGKLHGFWVD
jgi:hypothetical protein